MPNIQIRIDKETKKSAQKVLDGLGLDMSSAIKVYLRQIIITESIPIKLVTENGFSPAKEKALLKAIKEAERVVNVTKEMSMKEAMDYLK